MLLTTSMEFLEKYQKPMATNLEAMASSLIAMASTGPLSLFKKDFIFTVL